MNQLSLLDYCIKCEARCCKTGEYIGSPILSEDEAKSIKSNLEEVVSPTGQKYWIITEKDRTNECSFLTEEKRCGIQNIKPLDCLCYPIKAVYEQGLVKFVVDSDCLGSEKLGDQFIENAKEIAIQSIMRFDPKTYQHWLDNNIGWVKKAEELKIKDIKKCFNEERLSYFLRKYGRKFDRKFLTEIGFLVANNLNLRIDESVKEITPREEGNVITAYCFRNTVLEDYHAEGVPINNRKMKTLMIEASTKMSKWLALRDVLKSNGDIELYNFILRVYEACFTKDWKK